MQPRKLYDLVCEVAIVRPGPIQSGMVHPFIMRWQGLQDRVSLDPELDPILDKTCGVPLFQEQAMQIAIAGAGFSPSEADQMRRALATFKRMGTIGQLRDKFISGMIGRGHDQEFAERCFAQIEGFSATASLNPMPHRSRGWSMSRPGSNATTRRFSRHRF